jgi:hypothetical protein
VETKDLSKLDWRAKYHTFDEVNNAPEPAFLIENFLQRDIVTALAAPVAQRKSIIALNIAHACLTREALFGRFTVVDQPARVLYLVPEMGLIAMARRIRAIGLMDYIGKTLFLRTMNSEGFMPLSDLTATELKDALVIVDTAARFISGNENSSEHMKLFSDDCFSVMRAEPAAMLVLFHSGKETKVASELTLENSMRGSGELGAAVSTCWATKLQDPDPAVCRTTPSILVNVKQRDFEAKSFEALSSPNYKMNFVDGSEGAKVVIGSKANADGKQDAADAIIRQHPSMSGAALAAELEKAGIVRGKSWACERKKTLAKLAYDKMQKDGGKLPRVKAVRKIVRRPLSISTTTTPTSSTTTLRS